LKSTPLDNLTNLPIPAYALPLSQHPKQIVSETDVPFIPGGGLTRRILSNLGPGWPLPVVALLQFALEGDNRVDAHMFATVVAKVLGIDTAVKEWKQPGSWKQGLFGAPPDLTLYG
jgi:proteasome assembly chaperone 2